MIIYGRYGFLSHRINYGPEKKERWPAVQPQQGLAVRAGPEGPGGGQSRAAWRSAPPRKDQTCVETTGLDGQGDAAAIKEKRRVCEACNSADARALEKRARRK